METRSIDPSWRDESIHHHSYENDFESMHLCGCVCESIQSIDLCLQLMTFQTRDERLPLLSSSIRLLIALSTYLLSLVLFLVHFDRLSDIYLSLLLLSSLIASWGLSVNGERQRRRECFIHNRRQIQKKREEWRIRSSVICVASKRLTKERGKRDSVSEEESSEKKDLCWTKKTSLLLWRWEEEREREE